MLDINFMDVFINIFKIVLPNCITNVIIIFKCSFWTVFISVYGSVNCNMCKIATDSWFSWNTVYFKRYVQVNYLPEIANKTNYG